MQLSNIPFGTTDWSTIAPTEHPGETGKALWRTRQFGAIRVRLVEYTPGYLADLAAISPKFEVLETWVAGRETSRSAQLS